MTLHSMWHHIYWLLLVLTALVEGVHGYHSTITWVSPSGGEIFYSGDKILCQWTADNPVVSASFQLCMLYDDLGMEERNNTNPKLHCGEAVWPAVKERSRVYTSSLGVPDPMAEGTYTLQMKDDFGSKFESSSFSLRSTREAPDSTNIPSSDGAQVPLGSPADSVSSSAVAAAKSPDFSNVAYTSSATVAPTFDSTAASPPESSDGASLGPSATASPQVDPSSAGPHRSNLAGPLGLSASKANASSPILPASTPHAVNISSSSVTPQDLTTRRPPSTAAFAVPLSAIGAIFVIAAGLAFRHRRKLREERAKDAEKLALSRQSSINSYKSAGEVQYALDVLSRHEIGYGTAPAPVPLFMPVERVSEHREPRWPTERLFAPASFVACTPSARSPESIRTSRSRPLLTRSGLSPRSDVQTLLGANDTANLSEDLATHSVIADYFQPSPPLPPSLLAGPQSVHVRNEVVCLPVSAHMDVYNDKPLPRSPRSRPPLAGGER